MAEKLMVVIPCYNEEEVLPETSRRLVLKMGSLMEKGLISEDSRVLLVNDGSKDRTWELISELHKENPLFEGVKLSRNRGHQNALLAGLMTARNRCDVCISMDADLQDDMDAMDKFLEKHQEGCEIVYGVRSKREKDTFFKRETALMFYRLMSGMGVDIVFNHADYRLLSKRVLLALDQYTEVNVFLRGLIRSLGFVSCEVPFDVSERYAGQSKYSPAKMMRLAMDGITSFSVRPLRIISITGFICVFFCLCFIIYDLVVFLQGEAITGWTSMMISMWLIGGMLMISLGCVGEYVGKIYMEAKRRPRYLIAEAQHEAPTEAKDA